MPSTFYTNIWYDEASTIPVELQPRTTTTAEPEATVERYETLLREVNAKQAAREPFQPERYSNPGEALMMYERGIHPIPESEVTHRDNYVIWNRYDNSYALRLDDSYDVICSYSRIENVLADAHNRKESYSTEYAIQILSNLLLKLEQSTAAYPGKIARIQGWFKYLGSTVYMGVSVCGRQVYQIPGYDESRLRGSILPAGDAVPCARPAMTSDDRIIWIAAVANRRRLDLANRPAEHIGRFITDTRSASASRRLAYRGVNVYASAFASVRNEFRNIGAEIAAAMRNESDWTADEMVESLDELPSTMREIADNIMNIWNQHCDCGEEIERFSCGHLGREGDGHSTYNGDVCATCFEDDYVWVENIEDYRHRDNVYLHESDDCYYTYPEEDDDDEDDDEDVPRCVRGYSSNVLDYLAQDRSITPSAYGEFLMGIELEVVPNGGPRMASDCAEHTTESLCDKYAILKSDGSLDDGGFEIVTAPRGLKEHIERFKKWEPHLDLRAWDPECCGMHVHISSAAFSQATLGKFIEFINAEYNDAFIESIAGRHPRSDSQCRQYCQREGAISQANPKQTLAGKGSSRYHMVNTANMTYDEARRLGLENNHSRDKSINTVELRVFRATLKKSRLLAQIEFAHAAVMFCRWTSMRELKREHFLKWLRDMAGVYPHLAKWFGVKANTKKVEAKPAVQAEAEV